MKNLFKQSLFVLFPVLLFFANEACHHQVKPRAMKASISWDSVGHASISDSFGMVIQHPCPSADSLLLVILRSKIEKDSLKTQLFLAQFKVERIELYVGIVDHDHSQLKFLKGWIKRAITIKTN